MDTTIRNMDAATYRKFKAVAALRNVTVGAAVNEAMLLWLEKNNNGKDRL